MVKQIFWQKENKQTKILGQKMLQKIRIIYICCCRWMSQFYDNFSKIVKFQAMSLKCFQSTFYMHHWFDRKLKKLLRYLVCRPHYSGRARKHCSQANLAFCDFGRINWRLSPEELLYLHIGEKWIMVSWSGVLVMMLLTKINGIINHISPYKMLACDKK